MAQTHSSGPPSIANFPNNKKCEVMILGAKEIELALIKDFESKAKSISGFIKELSLKLSLESLGSINVNKVDKKECTCEKEKKNVDKLKKLFSYYVENVYPLPDSACTEAKMRKDLMNILANIIFELEK